MARQEKTPIRTTLLELIACVDEETDGPAETVAVVTSLLRTHTIRPLGSRDVREVRNLPSSA